MLSGNVTTTSRLQNTPWCNEEQHLSAVADTIRELTHEKKSPVYDTYSLLCSDKTLGVAQWDFCWKFDSSVWVYVRVKGCQFSLSCRCAITKTLVLLFEGLQLHNGEIMKSSHMGLLLWVSFIDTSLISVMRFLLSACREVKQLFCTTEIGSTVPVKSNPSLEDRRVNFA